MMLCHPSLYICAFRLLLSGISRTLFLLLATHSARASNGVRITESVQLNVSYRLHCRRIRPGEGYAPTKLMCPFTIYECFSCPFVRNYFGTGLHPTHGA